MAAPQIAVEESHGVQRALGPLTGFGAPTIPLRVPIPTRHSGRVCGTRVFVPEEAHMIDTVQFLRTDCFLTLAGFSFVFGLLFGSFFNVCIYRMPSGQSLVWPNSHCYTCGTPIRWYDNIPVLSYFLLGGRCRTCHVPFSMRYALVELLTGGLFLIVYLRFGYSWTTLSCWVFTGLLIIGTFTDIDGWIILDRITIGGAIAGIVFALVMAFLPYVEPPIAGSRWVIAHAGPAPLGVWWGPVANSVVGALAGALLLWGIGFLGSIVFRKQAMGFGDVKLMLLFGAFLGWQLSIALIFLASFLGAVYGISMMAASAIVSRRKPLPTEEARQAESDRTVEEIRRVVDDPAEGPSFTNREKSVLVRTLAKPVVCAVSESPRHLPFGPHLAMAAWILMTYEGVFRKAFDAYLSLFNGEMPY
jgi:leader peptidase (prepilin peptidase)/N-methyltransferase